MDCSETNPFVVRGRRTEEERMERNGRRQRVESREANLFSVLAKCKQNDSPVMHRGIWRKSSSCDDWFQWYQPTLALYQPERHIYYPRPPRLEQMLRGGGSIRASAQISSWILYYSISGNLSNSDAPSAVIFPTHAFANKHFIRKARNAYRLN